MFTPRDGVPESVALDVQADPDGFVWMSSPLGLARYDGHRWTLMEPAAVRGTVHDLYLDRAGVLWAPSRDKGISRHEGGRWHIENRATGLASNHFTRVVETDGVDGKPELWALKARKFKRPFRRACRVAGGRAIALFGANLGAAGGLDAPQGRPGAPSSPFSRSFPAATRTQSCGVVAAARTGTPTS